MSAVVAEAPALEDAKACVLLVLLDKAESISPNIGRCPGCAAFFARLEKAMLRVVNAQTADEIRAAIDEALTGGGQ